MIIAFMPDLIMRSKLEVATNHYQVDTLFVSDMEAFRAGLVKSVHTILIDLDADEEISLEMVRLAKDSDSRVIGFCSHVLTDLMEKARNLGANMVYTNSTITAAIPGLVSEIAHSLKPDSNSTHQPAKE